MSRLAQRLRGARILALDIRGRFGAALRGALERGGAARVVIDEDLGAGLRSAAAEPFDLVLLDWNPPQLSGLELVDRLRQAGRQRDATFVVVADAISKEMRALEEPYRIAAFLERSSDARQAFAALDLAWQARQNPSEFELLLRRGWHMLEGNAFDKALLVYNWLRQVDPSSLAALYGAGRAMSGQGQLEEARRVFEEVVDRSPLFLQAYRRLGEVAQKQGDGETVFRILQRVVDLTPNRPDNLVQLARQHYANGETDQAEEHLRRALELNPALWEASLILTEILVTQARLEEASTLVQEVRRHHPGQTDLLNNLGLALRKAGKLDDAAKSYAIALAIQPDNPVLIYNAAVVDFLQERDAEAIERLDRVVTLDPNLTTARRFRAFVASGRKLSPTERAALFP